MRRSRDQTAESRSRITAAAARLIREGGIVGTGVAEVMKAADMTHGGFYRHFASKDALVAEAVQQAADETLGRLDDLTGEDLRSAVRSYLSDYLSSDTCPNPVAAVYLRPPPRKVHAPKTRSAMCIPPPPVACMTLSPGRLTGVRPIPGGTPGGSSRLWSVPSPSPGRWTTGTRSKRSSPAPRAWQKSHKQGSIEARLTAQH